MPPPKGKKNVFYSDSSSDSEDLGYIGSVSGKTSRPHSGGVQHSSGSGSGKKRVRNFSGSENNDDEDEIEREGGGDRGSTVRKSLDGPVSLLSLKKQSAFLAWIDAFRKQWDGYWNKLPEAIVKIRFVEKMPLTTWVKSGPSEYGFYANVNPEGIIRAGHNRLKSQ